MSIPLPPNDPAMALLIEGIRDPSKRSVVKVYDSDCYICRDPEFALMGMPLCEVCPQCSNTSNGKYVGHIPADDDQCTVCEYTRGDDMIAWENPYPGQHLATTHFDGLMYSNLPEIVRDVVDANLVTSLVDRVRPVRNWATLELTIEEPTHKPVIDIDMPVKVTESTTPGHHHLFIDKELTWSQYLYLLDVLAELGIVEQGYVNASRERGFTAVRLPWIKKENIDG